MAGEHQKSLVSHLRASGRHELAGKLEKLKPHHIDAYLKDFVTKHQVTPQNVNQKLADARARIAAKKDIKEDGPVAFARHDVLTPQAQYQLSLKRLQRQRRRARDEQILDPKIQKTKQEPGGHGHDIGEDLQEISKETLSSYLTKAHKDHYARRHGAPDGNGGTVPFSSKLSQAKYDGDKGEIATQRRKIDNRSKGMERAFNRRGAKLEDFQLDELSKSALQRYISHANADKGFHKWNQGHKAGLQRYDNPPEENKRLRDQEGASETKAIKRDKGMFRAVSKLAREETELTELSKSTLVTYINKNVGNSAEHGSKFTRAKRTGDPEGAYKAQRNVRNRIKGATRAAARLAYTDGHPISQKRTIHIGEALHAVAKERFILAAEDRDMTKTTRHPTEKRAYVQTLKPHATSDGQIGYKSSNKHGKIKFWNSLGGKSAMKHAGLSEEVLDELSNQTLKNYTWHRGQYNVGLSSLIHKAKKRTGQEKPSEDEISKQHEIGAKNRTKGRKLAATKISRSGSSAGAPPLAKAASTMARGLGMREETLDELSNKTRSSYVSKTLDGLSATGKIAPKRVAGLKMASRARAKALGPQRWPDATDGRSVKEETEITEVSKGLVKRYLQGRKDQHAETGGRDFTNPTSFRKAMEIGQVARAKAGLVPRHGTAVDVKVMAKGAKPGVSKRRKPFGEDLELQELSKNTLRSYVDKASDEMPHREKKMREFPGDNEMDPFKKVQNRHRGISKASNKLRH